MDGGFRRRLISALCRVVSFRLENFAPHVLSQPCSMLRLFKEWITLSCG